MIYRLTAWATALLALPATSWGLPRTSRTTRTRPSESHPMSQAQSVAAHIVWCVIALSIGAACAEPTPPQGSEPAPTISTSASSPTSSSQRSPGDRANIADGYGNAMVLRETERAQCSMRKFGDCVDAAIDTINDNIARFLVKIPLLALALLIVLAAHWLSKFLANRLQWLRIRSDNPYMSGLVRTLVRSAVLLVGVLIALDLLGWTPVVSAVLGSAGVVGLVLGFAFRDIAENYIAGILLGVRRPFEPGDHIAVEGREGKVISVNSRATVLMTMDGNHLQLPNGLVFKSVLLNYTRNPRRRFDFLMLIDGSQSIRRAQTVAMAAVAEVEGVLDEPAPSWAVVEYGAAGIQLRFFGWVDQRQNDLGKVRSEAIRRVKAAFADADIEAPRTVYHIVTNRSRDAHELGAIIEPLQNGGIDISVNRDIDLQVAEARQQSETRDLLTPETDKTSK
ncbi:MAG: mechanosensitive ion channel family protein [Lysobacteraceae bacterium]|nr:MAG: mechanosensitive ion channel family protein [Xanthomonadaceae bacterium]